MLVLISQLVVLLEIDLQNLLTFTQMFKELKAIYFFVISLVCDKFFQILFKTACSFASEVISCLKKVRTMLCNLVMSVCDIVTFSIRRWAGVFFGFMAYRSVNDRLNGVFLLIGYLNLLSFYSVHWILGFWYSM